MARRNSESIMGHPSIQKHLWDMVYLFFCYSIHMGDTQVVARLC
jgi:hypothetical protein